MSYLLASTPKRMTAPNIATTAMGPICFSNGEKILCSMSRNSSLQKNRIANVHITINTPAPYHNSRLRSKQSI
jgi:hypothetical protein